MTQPTERRFVMEPRLDAEIETINDALDTKVDLTDPRLTDERTPLDDSVTSAKIVDGTIVGADIDDATIESVNLAEQEYIKFDTTYTGGSTQPGELAWDPDNETLEFQLDAHVTLQIGQEHVMRIKNNSGSVAIPERTVVMFAGAAGDTIKVSPAVSDGSINVNYLAGITTEEIAADGFGFITQLGFINQVNTNAWPVGTILYVDPATPGGLTATEPESPAWTMPVAAVTKQNASSGRLLVRAIPGGSGAGGGASVNVSDTAPAGGNEGDLWLDSTDGTLYVYYEDVDGSQWIQVQANSALGASIESRLGALESQAIALGTYSPNYIINGAFEINQRNFTSTTSTGFGFDRWSGNIGGGGATYSAQIFTTGSAPVAGYESRNFARFVTTGQTLSGTSTILQQNIESVRTLSGNTVTVSFWAKAGSGSPKISVEFDQQFGTGGSPSSRVTTYAGQVTLSTSWTRYSVTTFIPSIAGKTIGTSNDDYLRLNFWVSAGSDFNARTNSLGIQSNTFDFWGVQLEQGSTATSFRRSGNTIQEELANCQRYYYRMSAIGAFSTFGLGYAASTTQFRLYPQIPVTLRALPVVESGGAFGTRGAVGTVGVSSPTIDGSLATPQNVVVAWACTGAAAAASGTIIAENSATAFIGFSAEL